MMATPETKLPSNDGTLYLCSWNAGLHKTHKGISEVRHMIVNKVVSAVQKSMSSKPVIFLQEALAKKSVEGKWGVEDFTHDGRVKGTCAHRSGLSTPRSEVLRDSEYFPLTEYLDDPRIRDLDMRTFANIIHLEYKSKTKYVGKASLIVVSFHMTKPKKEDIKIEMIEVFFEKMRKVANDQLTTVVIGGDFNLQISKWADYVKKQNGDKVAIPHYKPTPRRQHTNRGVIDTLAIVYPDVNGECVHYGECWIESCVPIYPFPLTYDSLDLKVDEDLIDYPDANDVQYKIVKYNKEELEKLSPLLDEVQTTLEAKATKQSPDSYHKPASSVDEMTAKLSSIKLEGTPVKAKPVEDKIAPQIKKEKLPQPTPLWPDSLYYEVLNHDPLLAKLKVKLKWSKIDPPLSPPPSLPQTQLTPSKAKSVPPRKI